ncbi:MAG: chemotaxis protein CheA [Halobacteriales archaeon]|nr:chemotaxis protein CheA [Halobacteriales archaeon]
MSEDYLDAFIQESREEITKLNNSLLSLESNPDDEEAMEQIFRTAHTLKGNFGAMGFDAASELAHAIEDLLDAIRDGEIDVTPSIMDLIFEGVDLIEAIVDEIDQHGESTIDPSDIESQIRVVIEDGSAPEATDSASTTDTDEEAAPGDEPGTSDGPIAGTADLLGDTDVMAAEYDQLHHVNVEMGDSDMPGVDAMFVIEAAEQDGSLIESQPDRSAIEDGDYEDTFELLIADVDPEILDEELSTNTATDSITVTPIDGSMADTASTAEDTLADAPAAESAEAGSADEAEPAGSTEPADTAESDAADEDRSNDPSTGDSSGDEIQSVRVDVDQLDVLHGLVEQLVTSRIKLRRAVTEGDRDAALDNLDELDKITSSLQDTVMDMRLIPLKKVVGKFPRLVRDLAREQDKQIDFQMSGQDVELDRTILTELSDPLMHILRNAVDHGIEPPAEREERGKPPTGTIELRAERERDHVTVEIEDDGRGLDVEEIADKAIEEGIKTPADIEEMDDDEIYPLIFHPGFSTADEVTDVSGRGVGMDVVQETVSQLDGSYTVDSEPGEGTVVTLKLPVTVAIVKVLFVRANGREYGIPIKSIDEIMGRQNIRTINGTEVHEHDDEIYPIIDLGETLAIQETADNGQSSTDGESMLIRIRENERLVALECDAVENQEEVVVKPLEGVLRETPGLGGTAVLGDGDVVPILDVETLGRETTPVAPS